MAVIPAGTGNAMARSLQLPDAVAATLNLLKGQPRPLDLMSVRQEGEPLVWSFLLFMWGLIADIDIESEKYRWAGDARFTLSGVGTLCSLEPGY
jgi:diacylglycerol kinase family enzyme